jgi:hypothetical protein
LVTTDLAAFGIDKRGDAGMALVELADGVSVMMSKQKLKPNSAWH